MKRGLKGNAVALVIGLTLFLACGTAYASETEMQPVSITEIETEQMNSDAESKEIDTVENVQVDSEKGSDEQTTSDSEAQEVTVPDMQQGWVTTEAGTMYYVDNQPVVGEKKIDGYWYYFDESGIMATGLTIQAGKEDKTYYYEDDGKVHYGWLEIDGKQYYFHPVTGIMLKNTEYKIDGAYYYFDENGVMATGWTVQASKPDKQYYYDSDGKMHYEWLQSGDAWYYFHPVTGVMQVNTERKINDSYYYFNEKGVMATGWTQHHNHTYYYQPDGRMTYGEKKIDGYWYYFHSITGVMATGWSNHDSHRYYYQPDGRMYYGEKKIDGYWYYFHSITGVMATGWSNHDNHTYYYQSNGRMYYGEKKIGDYWYYFKPVTGIMATGWATQSDKPGKQYYYNARGQMQYGWQAIGNHSYFFDKVTGVMKPYTFTKTNGYWLAYDKNGKLVKDLRSAFGNESSYVIKVNKPMNTVTVYIQYGDGSYTVPLVAFICSTGASTPTGTFYTPDKWRWLRMMGPSWGQWVTQITGDYLFHSVYYNSQNNNNNLSVSAYNNLGKQVSHGCIRLTAGDAKWIYDHCTLGTKVVIYSDTSSYGPLGRPTAYKLPSWHTWDPTDPNMYYKCQQRGCH